MAENKNNEMMYNKYMNQEDWRRLFKRLDDLIDVTQKEHKRKILYISLQIQELESRIDKLEQQNL